jgi:tRNA dimethylallyltransferase
MMEAGWLDEARALHALALPEASPARKALGYPQLFAHVEGRLPLADAVSEIKLRTRQFARRQHVWFRAERGAELLDPEAAEARLRAAIA